MMSQITKKLFVSLPSLSNTAVSRLLEIVHTGAGAQEAGQGVVPLAGGGVIGLACHVCPALPGDGDGVGQRDHLSAVGLQEPRLLQQKLM